jgi:hypothetical protein
MYVRGNPLRYTDPSGHYTNDEIMQHFGCSDWACVEGFFNDGGSYAGMWGWLYMLQMAEDGWSVQSTKVTGNGQQYTVWGQFQRNIEGRINILAKGIRGPGLNHTFDAFLPESDFARYSQGASFGYYQVSGSSGERYVKSVNQQTLDCRRTDCTGRALNAVSTGSSLVAAGCAYFLVAPCVTVASGVSLTSGIIATVRTAGNAYSLGDDATAVDMIDIGISTATTAAGYLAHPYAAPLISGGQWVYDEYISRAMR